MNRRGQWTGVQERTEIGEWAATGQTDAQTAAVLGCSIWTVRKWRRRMTAADTPDGPARPGRPPTGPLGTTGRTMREAIIHLRREHPGWGAATILAALRADPTWAGEHLPSRSRVAAFLKDTGLTRHYQRHSELPHARSTDAAGPHATWQLDAQGVTAVTGVGRVCLITGIDCASRLKVESYPSVETTNPPMDDYVLALRRAFLTYGLPASLSLDHGTVFYDNTTPSPYPTRLHLWLVALGVAVQFIRKGRPTDHGIVERAHQTMTSQTLDGQTWEDQRALWEGLDARREALNTQIPTHSLNGRAPRDAFPAARHSGRPYRPEWEEDLLDLDRVYTYLAGGRWFREAKGSGIIKLGGYRYYLGRAYTGRTIVVTFDQATAQFLCQPEDSDVSIAVPAQGLSKRELMGELDKITRLPSYQLALPLWADTWRHQAYVTLLTGTN